MTPKFSLWSNTTSWLGVGWSRLGLAGHLCIKQWLGWGSVPWSGLSSRLFTNVCSGTWASPWEHGNGRNTGVQVQIYKPNSSLWLCHICWYLFGQSNLYGQTEFRKEAHATYHEIRASYWLRSILPEWEFKFPCWRRVQSWVWITWNNNLTYNKGIPSRVTKFSK